MFRPILPNRWFIWTLAIIFAVFICVEGEIVRLGIEQQTDSLLISARQIPHKTGKGVYTNITDSPSASSQPSQSFGGQAGQFETDVSNWKTYRNIKYGFEFKYPFEFEKTFESDAIVVFSNKNNIKNGVPEKLSIDIYKNSNTNRLSLWQWAESQTWPMTKKPKDYFYETNINVDVVALADPHSDMIIILRNSDVYIIDNGISEDRNLMKKEVYRQILTTFKFINPEDMKKPELN